MQLCDRLRAVEWVSLYILLLHATETEVGLGPASPPGWEGALFRRTHYVHEADRQTHPHGWRDAPGPGLAVTEPEGAVVPGNRRVDLQLMPLFLEGRRTRKDFSLALFTVGVVVPELCL